MQSVAKKPFMFIPLIRGQKNIRVNPCNLWQQTIRVHPCNSWQQKSPTAKQGIVVLILVTYFLAG